MGCCGSKDATESEIALTDAQSIRSVSSLASSGHADLGNGPPQRFGSPAKPSRGPPSIASLTSSEFADLENGPPERFAPDHLSGTPFRVPTPIGTPTPSRTPSPLYIPWVHGPPQTLVRYI